MIAPDEDGETRLLFHFSESSGIRVFEPRRVAVPAPRQQGLEWLNGPLVWAIDEWHQPLYLFPRDCPRVLVWPNAATTRHDMDLHWWMSDARMIAYVELSWLNRISGATLFRYSFRPDSFEPLDDAGMWVSRSPATPVHVDEIRDLPDQLSQAGVELRALSDLRRVAVFRDTTLHVSGIRLRNMAGTKLPS